MPGERYCWAKARDILSESDKTRLAVWALVHLDQCKSDWKTVALEMGSASGNSAAVMHGGMLKKLREKGAVYADGEGPSPATPSKPAATPASGKKRKTPAKKSDGAEGDEEGSPSKKARKPRAKKADTPLSFKNEPDDSDSIFNSTEASTIIAGSQDVSSAGADLFDSFGGVEDYID